MALQQKKHLTVLIADDEPLLRMLLGEILDEAGHKVIETSSSATAMAMYNKHREVIDLIITDNDMEAKNAGLQMLSSLRHRDRNIPVLMVSGGDGAAIMARLKTIPGNNHFLAKPYTAEQLSGKLAEMTKPPHHHQR